MKLFWKAAIALAVVAPISFAGSRVVDDGGAIPVIQDEVPPLVDQWMQTGASDILRLAASVPATAAVLLGIRSGRADYDRMDMYDGLTQGIPYVFHDEVMRNRNYAAAFRARRRQLIRIISNDTAQRFFNLFPEWWASHTTCMTQGNKLEAIRQLAPRIAARIDTTNAEFAALAAREANGTLTVSQREAYLVHNLRVPHLAQLPAASWQLSGDWIAVDPSDLFPRNESEGPLVRECPLDDHSHGGHIKACFDYVNIDLYSSTGQSSGVGRSAPTSLGQEVHSNLKRSGETRDFVLQMMEHMGEQVALRRLAEQTVANLPASEVSAGYEKWRVRAEYEMLRCTQ